jgi:hypothetical protein
MLVMVASVVVIGVRRWWWVFLVWWWGGDVVVVGGIEVVVRCWCGSVWIWCRWCVVDACVSGFPTIPNSLTVFQICWDLQDSFWVSVGVQICWDLQVFAYLVDLFCIGVDCLEVVCELRLICLGSRSTGDHHFWLKELFLDSDEPITFYSRSKVIVWWHFYGSGCCILRWSGSCRVSSSKIEIRSRPLLGGVWFGLFIGVLLIYGAFVFVACLLRVSARLVQRLDYL